MKTKSSIIIVDDHQIVIDGLKGILNADTRWEVTAEANDGQSAYEMISANPNNFQILLTDISMPLLTGTELCRMIKSKYTHISVLILSMYNNASAVKEVVMAEADGFILKNAGHAELSNALHRITEGGTYFSQDIAPLIWRQYNKEKEQDHELASLSAREKEVLGLIVKELTSEEIAEKLFVSKKTVDNHRQNLFAKCNCKSTVGLVKFAIRNGMGD